MNINYINGVVIGYFLVNWALLLNLFSSNKVGVALAIISMASAYVLESIRCGTDVELVPLANKILGAVMVISVFLSYLSWFFV